MNKYRISHCFLTLLLTALSFTAQLQAQQTPYEQAVARIEDLLRQQKLAEALVAAQEAIQMEPSQYKAYYYTAVVHYGRGSLDEAKTPAQKALELSPADRKKEVKVLVDTIAGAEQKQLADAAFDKGLIAKAATAYTEAWKLMSDEEVGLKAARLWGDWLSEPLKAAMILNKIVARPKSSEKMKEAQAYLTSINGALVTAYGNTLKEGYSLLRASNLVEAQKKFELASEARPDERVPYLYLARIFAKSGKVESVVEELGKASKIKLITLEEIASGTYFDDILNDGRLLTFLSESLGYSKETISEKIPKVKIDLRNNSINSFQNYITRQLNLKHDAIVISSGYTDLIFAGKAHYDSYAIVQRLAGLSVTDHSLTIARRMLHAPGYKYVNRQQIEKNDYDCSWKYAFNLSNAEINIGSIKHFTISFEKKTKETNVLPPWINETGKEFKIHNVWDSSADLERKVYEYKSWGIEITGTGDWVTISPLGEQIGKCQLPKQSSNTQTLYFDTREALDSFVSAFKTIKLNFK